MKIMSEQVKQAKGFDSNPIVEKQPRTARLSQSELQVDKSVGSISVTSREESHGQRLIVSKSEKVVASDNKQKKQSKFPTSHQKTTLSHKKTVNKEDPSPCGDPQKHKSIESPQIVRQESKGQARQSENEISLSKLDTKAVKSKLASIFRDRLKYRQDIDEHHKLQVKQLRDMLKESNEEIIRLNRQISILKAVKHQPAKVNVPRDGKRELLQLRNENETLRRISKEVCLRKQLLQEEVEELKERCSFYKAEHRKVYEQYLLKNAESAVFSEHLSLIIEQQNNSLQVGQMILESQGRGEISQIERQNILEQERESQLVGQQGEEQGETGKQDGIEDELEDVSLKMNDLALQYNHGEDHNLQEPSFKSGEEAHLEFYSAQNIHLTDNSITQRTLEHECKLPRNSYVQNSSAMAVLDRHSPLEDLYLEGIQLIEAKYHPNQGEIQTQRLILSQMMPQRKQNSLSDFQLIFSQHPPQLSIVSFGCLAEYKGRSRTISIVSKSNYLTIAPLPPPQLTIILSSSITIFPMQKLSAASGTQVEVQTEQIQAENRAKDLFCHPTTAVNIFTQIFCASLTEDCTVTVKNKKETFTNTDAPLFEEFSKKTLQTQTISSSTNTDTPTYGELACQTITQYSDISMCTDKPQVKEEGVTTTLLQFSQSDTQKQIKMFNIGIFDVFHGQIKKSRLEIAIQIFTFTVYPHQKVNIGLRTNLPSIPSSSTSTSLTTKEASNMQTKHLQLSPNVAQHTILPVVQLHILPVSSGIISEQTTGSKLQLDLSFLKTGEIQGASLKQHEQKTISEKRAEEVQSFSSKKVNSSRTCSQSQGLHSNRSEFIEKKIQTPLRAVIPESIISEHSSSSDTSLKQSDKSKTNQQSPRKYCINKNPTARCTISVENTFYNNPSKNTFLWQTKKARQSSMRGPKKLVDQMFKTQSYENPCSQNEKNIIIDYFYKMKNLNFSTSIRVAQKNNVTHYNLGQNMYIFHASKGGRLDKFACWQGKVIHFGPKTEFIELNAPLRTCEVFSERNISLGNCQFRISENKLEVNRALKKRCFRGKMENGQWRVERVWIYTAN